MKHIQIYEQFNVLNEGEKKELSGGYINSNLVGKDTDEEKDQHYSGQKNEVVFHTDVRNGEGDLKIRKWLGPYALHLNFAQAGAEPQIINFKKSEPRKEAGIFEDTPGTILAKTPAEAQSKALDILLYANLLANDSFESKKIGNLVKAFVEIQKMYPEFMRLNPLFGGFFKGLTTCWINPKYSSELRIDDYAGGFKKMLTEEIKKALVEKGVVK